MPTRELMSEYRVVQYGRRCSVVPELVVSCTTGLRTYPIAHVTGEDVDEMVPRSIANAKL